MSPSENSLKCGAATRAPDFQFEHASKWFHYIFYYYFFLLRFIKKKNPPPRTEHNRNPNIVGVKWFPINGRNDDLQTDTDVQTAKIIETFFFASYFYFLLFSCFLRVAARAHSLIYTSHKTRRRWNYYPLMRRYCAREHRKKSKLFV